MTKPTNVSGPGGPGPQADTHDAPQVALSMIDGQVLDVTRALFAGYGVKLELDGSPISRILPSVQLISTLGFSSPKLGGSILLAVPNEVLSKTLAAADANLADWCAELANQLVGRLKNQLLNYGVAINLALPVVLAGGELRLPARARQHTRHLSFVSEWGHLFVRTEIELNATIELVRQTAAGETAGVDEGELLLF
jgi:hypothetical protein